MLDLLQCLDERKSEILESNKVQYSLLHANIAKYAERLPLNSQHNYLQPIQNSLWAKPEWAVHAATRIGEEAFLIALALSQQQTDSLEPPSLW